MFKENIPKFNSIVIMYPMIFNANGPLKKPSSILIVIQNIIDMNNDMAKDKKRFLITTFKT